MSPIQHHHLVLPQHVSLPCSLTVYYGTCYLFFHVNVNSPLRTGTSGNFNPNLKLLGDTVHSICIIQNMKCLNKIHTAIVRLEQSSQCF